MKYPIVLLSLICASTVAGAIPLPDTPAPDFTATVVTPDELNLEGKVVDNFQLSSLLGKKRIMLMTYPKNCTYICPTELIAVNKNLNQFKALGYEVLVLSTDKASLKKDPEASHQAWRQKSSEPGEGAASTAMGIGNVGFIMVSDPDRKIIKKYGVEGENGLALRATFFIDLNKQVRIADVQSNSIGRDVDELLRKAAAVKFAEENAGKLVPPEGWKPGDPGMKPEHQGVREQMKK